ncbi:non-specific lipid transfer protein GPI-anchored 2-like [Salvia hispanica]|uniref:non-specific lipid transfer protein GPI-anchored 2-like n=1 Tax=Salvia hispanica TaxID=49212 RepID=UPI002009C8C3|nr:non-specific lipid transfer protein GPI-anchored 2-like [Salvia hispanica]
MSSTTSIAYLLMIAVTVGVATAQSPAPALDCFTYLLKLSDCLTFVEEGSNLSQPAPGCCPELANLVDTQPICLCQLLGDPSHSQIGISVDLNRALQLPSLCNVITPPVSLCAAIGIPPTPSDALSPGGDELALPPSPGGDNGSATNLVSKHHFLIGLAPLFCVYFF